MWFRKDRLDVSGLAIRKPALEIIQEYVAGSKTTMEIDPMVRTSEHQGLGNQTSTSGREWQISLPLNLRFGAVKGGGPDLQLQILEFSTGCRTQPPSSQKAGVSFCQNAAALLFFRVLFPDQVEQYGKPFLGVGLTAASTKFLVQAWQTQSGRNLRRGRGAKQKGENRISSSLYDSVSDLVDSVTNKISDLAQPAAILALAAILWRQTHQKSFNMGQAILVAINLSSGYNETKRQAASGKIQSGPQLEAAWRKRHKWAAQKAGKVMTDIYDTPPLRPYVSAAQKLSIGFLMLMNQSPSGVGFGRSCGTENGQISLIASYPGGRRKFDKEADNSLPTSQPPPLPTQTQNFQNGQVDLSQLSINYEPLESFKPYREEDLPTGDLPTITCFEDLAKYKAGLQNSNYRPCEFCEEPQNCQHTEERSGPINIAANASGTRPAQVQEEAPKIPDEIVLFTTEELKSMDPGMRNHVDYSEENNDGPKLALYGRADHTPQPDPTILDKQRMVVRACFLVMFFLPFLLLGPLLLGLSNRFQKAPKVAASSQEHGKGEQIGEIVESASKAPVPHSKVRSFAWHLLLWGIRNSGAAFIKWGQWSATREDMFPAEFCSILSELHDAAPVHSWEESRKEIESSFGKTCEELFETIDEKPLASGSIAQVHKAIMIIGGKRRSVVVKVRHPGVDVSIRQDFQILKPLAAAASKVKSLKGLSLKESLAQFSSSMTAQTDLRVEAAHLIRFFRNFAPVRGSVTPPFPLPEYITEGALIETFEPGQSVAKYIRNPAPFNTQIVALGVDTYLKMLLEDNFVHTDLHPGNILVRRQDGGQLSTEVGAEEVRGTLQLILLDFGLAEELNPSVRKHFISFLHMIAAGNGKHAAEHILCWSKNQACMDPEGFTQAMIKMFKVECQIGTPEGIELDRVMKAVLQIARQYEVTIDSSYAALVIGVVVLVGFATSLDPGLNLMDAAAPAFLQNNLLGKVSGRLYS